MAENRHQSSGTSATYFEPALYNNAELSFFVKHIGESPMVACHKGHLRVYGVDGLLQFAGQAGRSEAFVDV